jgi:intein/homing endonuclease
MKYGEYRPDLIILDDVEDVSDERGTVDRIHEWFNNEIVPLGNSGTKIVVLGNLICHFWDDPWMSEQSFILQLRKKILNESVPGIFRAYPLTDIGG